MALLVVFEPEEQLEPIADNLAAVRLRPDPEVPKYYITSAYNTGRELAEALEIATVIHRLIITVIESDSQVTFIYPSCVYGGSCCTFEELELRHPEIAARVTR